MISPSEAARIVLQRQDARENLLAFTEYTHNNWQSGEHHRKICEALEAVERGDCRRLMIFAPPRHSKSEIASKRFPSWYLGRHPDEQVIACSYNAELATDFGRSVRNLVCEPRYQAVFPGVTLAADSQAAGRWHTSKGGVYVSTGVGGTLTGRGMTCGIIDDALKNREEADSPRTRETIWSWYTSTFYTRLMPKGAIVIMMTRWHEDDLAARALESEKWDVISLPAIANEGEPEEKALWPEWYNLETLKGIRSAIGPRDWAALYQQNPRTEEGSFFKREWFNEKHDNDKKNLRVYIAADFAVTDATDAKDPDYTELVVVGMGSDDRAYILDWWYGQTTADEWIERLLDLCERHKPHCFFGEAGPIRRAIEPTLDRRKRDRKIFFRQEWITSIHDKATRARALQAWSSMGRVVFPRTEWANRAIDQLVGFLAGSKHDDAVDALSLYFLAVDNAHPAIVPSEPEKRIVDTWQRVTPKNSRETAWKTR